MGACWVLLVSAATGCSKNEDTPDFDPPRRIRPTASDLTELKGRYVVSEGSRIEFELPTRRSTPAGRIDGVTGSLSIDAVDLVKTRGHITFDLSSLQIRESGDSGAPVLTRRALRWLGLGSQAPDRALAEMRMAEFEIEEITELTASAAHEGKLIDRTSSSGADGEDSLLGSEERAIQLVAIGQVRIRRTRVRVAVELEARFHYPAAALSGVAPDRIRLQSRSDVPISLAAHDIQPRDERGVIVARDLPILGREVGREAKVSISLIAERK